MSGGLSANTTPVLYYVGEITGSVYNDTLLLLCVLNCAVLVYIRY